MAHHQIKEFSLVAQLVKNLPAMQEIRLDPWVGKIPWRREWEPTLVFSPGEFHSQRSLEGYSPWGRKESSPAPQSEGIDSLAFCLLYGPVLTTVCDHWEDHSLDYTDLCRQSNVSAFQNTKFVIAFLLRSNGLLISRLQSLSAVILEPKKRKSVTASTFPLLFAMQLWGWMP